MSYEIIRTSPRGAALISDGERVAWIKPAAAKKLAEEDRLVPSAQKALAAGKSYEEFQNGAPATDKKKYVSVKISAIEVETDKAIKVADFNGNSGWLPKSQIYGYDHASAKSTGIWIPPWLASKNGFCGKKTMYA